VLERRSRVRDMLMRDETIAREKILKEFSGSDIARADCLPLTVGRYRDQSS
jgi:hypothetical protein